MNCWTNQSVTVMCPARDFHVQQEPHARLSQGLLGEKLSTELFAGNSLTLWIILLIIYILFLFITHIINLQFHFPISSKESHKLNHYVSYNKHHFDFTESDIWIDYYNSLCLPSVISGMTPKKVFVPNLVEMMKLTVMRIVR